MARLDNFPDLFSDGNDHGGVGGGKVNLLHRARIREVAAHGVGNHHGVVDDFRLAEGVHALTECSDDSEGKSAEFDDFADGIISVAIKSLGQLLRDEADFVVSLLVLGIKESTGNYD